MPPKRPDDRPADAAAADDMRERMIRNRSHGPHRYRAADACGAPGTASSHTPPAHPPLPRPATPSGPDGPAEARPTA